MRIFVNCSNHPSERWLETQRKEAEVYGEIRDVNFPVVPSDATSQQLDKIVEDTFQQIMNNKPEAVMCMGEFVVCYRLVQKLKEQEIKVLASCSERKSKEYIDENGFIKKEAVFMFRGFREY